jgi:hypothetical protein
MLLVKWMGLLDTEGLLYVSLNHAAIIVDALRNDIDEPLKLTLPGRKKARNKRPFYTFIGHDALDKSPQYLVIIRSPK